MEVLPGISEDRISAVFQRALGEKGLISGRDTALIFHDLSFLDARIKDLITLFPETALHAIAIKANPLHGILKRIAAVEPAPAGGGRERRPAGGGRERKRAGGGREQSAMERAGTEQAAMERAGSKGVGLEAASLPELYLAERAGVPPERIVFDSPVKTESEISYALKIGCHINADSFQELDRIADLLTGKRLRSRSTIGIRINPQVGAGAIDSTSVAGVYSKFGVPIGECRPELIERLRSHEWLRGVHLHIGSQGCSIDMLLEGIGRVLSLVNEASQIPGAVRAGRKIDIFDIGGGLPVSYHRKKEAIPMARYVAEMRSRFPELFSDRFRLITEFGRYIHANAGWVASRVEYVKKGPGFDTAMIHVGADLFLRKCYRPVDWHHEVLLLDSRGKLKKGAGTREYMIAGPLCFAGDIVAKGVRLPVVEEGDFIVILDAGAYTLSMWSRYNSRQAPKVIGYSGDGRELEILKKRESPGRVAEFWE